MNEHTGVKTVCHECGGSGEIVEQVMAASLDGKASGSALSVRVCRTCKGTGRLKGLVPPI